MVRSHLRFSVNSDGLLVSNNVSNTCEDLIKHGKDESLGSPHLPSVGSQRIKHYAGIFDNEISY